MRQPTALQDFTGSIFKLLKPLLQLGSNLFGLFAVCLVHETWRAFRARDVDLGRLIALCSFGSFFAWMPLVSVDELREKDCFFTTILSASGVFLALSSMADEAEFTQRPARR